MALKPTDRHTESPGRDPLLAFRAMICHSVSMLLLCFVTTADMMIFASEALGSVATGMVWKALVMTSLCLMHTH